jgi:predicted transcriptional regulator
MPALTRSRLTLLALLAALAGGLPACGTDDAIERDTRDTRENVDKGLGNSDEKAGEAAKDAGDEIEKGVEDVDGN